MNYAVKYTTTQWVLEVRPANQLKATVVDIDKDLDAHVQWNWQWQLVH
jgi:hypothetical protein